MLSHGGGSVIVLTTELQSEQLGNGVAHLCKGQFISYLGIPVQQQTIPTETMASESINPNVPAQEPELNLLIADKQFEEPFYKSLFRQLDEFFFPKKLPPLKLESKPEPVKDIWGFYSYWKVGAIGVDWILRFARHRHRAYRLPRATGL